MLPYPAIQGIDLNFIDKSKISLSPGQARDSRNSFDILNENMLVADITRKGVNGLDLGEVENGKFYGIFVIASSTGSKKAASLFSLSQTIPYLPEDYDIFRLVGFVTTASFLPPYIADQSILTITLPPHYASVLYGHTADGDNYGEVTIPTLLTDKKTPYFRYETTNDNDHTELNINSYTISL